MRWYSIDQIFFLLVSFTRKRLTFQKVYFSRFLILLSQTIHHYLFLHYVHEQKSLAREHPRALCILLFCTYEACPIMFIIPELYVKRTFDL